MSESMNECPMINIKYCTKKIHARHYKTGKRISASKENPWPDNKISSHLR